MLSQAGDTRPCMALTVWEIIAENSLLGHAPLPVYFPQE